MITAKNVFRRVPVRSVSPTQKHLSPNVAVFRCVATGPRYIFANFPDFASADKQHGPNFPRSRGICSDPCPMDGHFAQAGRFLQRDSPFKQSFNLGRVSVLLQGVTRVVVENKAGGPSGNPQMASGCRRLKNDESVGGCAKQLLPRTGRGCERWPDEAESLAPRMAVRNDFPLPFSFF